MKCPRCQQENRPGAKFCEECAAPLARACANCGAQLSATAKFCSECAHPAGPAGPPAPQRFGAPETYTPKHLAERIINSRAALEGERKQVTVLFADLKGSMELLADRDPEEARKILDPVLEHMMEAVHRYEGTVNQVMGDGIMALFGAPLAHEDHAVRACYAALRMQESVKRYATRSVSAGGQDIHIRVGLNSGEVVVRAIGSDLHVDYTAVGLTTHLAARMEQVADPGSTFLTPSTVRLVEGFVEVKPRGSMPVKGLAAPVEVSELTGATSARSRLQARAGRDLTRFVGREAEAAQLARALDRARGAQGQVVAVVGEPGVGKSRLFWEFVYSSGYLGPERIADVRQSSADVRIIRGHSVSYGKATPWFVVVDLMRDYFQIEPSDDSLKIAEKVTGKIVALDFPLESVLSPILWLLDAPVNDQLWEHLDPTTRRQSALESVKRIFLRESQVQPLVVVVEDLHWLDAEGQALLDLLVPALPLARVLLLVNYRPEYRHAWGDRTYYTQIRLDPLPPTHSRELLASLLGEETAPDTLTRELIERTHGNPFFLEETVRMLVEAGVLSGVRGAYRLNRTMAALEIPPTAEVVVAARIDRLGPDDKRLLQAAAVVGMDVPLTLLQAIADDSADNVSGGLARLQAGEFLYESALFPDIGHTFKHALTRDVAYHGLLQQRRRELHAGVVTAIEAHYADAATEHVEALAHHAARGELWAKAAVYCHEAGRRLSARSAYRQAAAMLEQALVAIARLPEESQIIERGVDVRLDLRGVLNAVGEGQRAFEHLVNAEKLGRRLGDRRRLARLMTEMTHQLWLAGRTAEARHYGEMALEQAETLDVRGVKVEIYFILGQAEEFWGEYQKAEEHLSKILELLASDDNPAYAVRTGGVYPAAACRVILAAVHAERGEYITGLQFGDEALRVAESVHHPFSIAYVIMVLAGIHLSRGDFAAAARLCERGFAVGGEAAIGFLSPWLGGFLGYSQTLTGAADQGLPRIRKAVEMQTAMGFRNWLSWFVGMLSEGLLLEGQYDEAQREAERALVLARECGEQRSEASVNALLGDIAASREPSLPDAAERYYTQGLAIAMTIGARPVIAKCHLGFGVLYRRTGRPERAADQLAQARDMFREMGMMYWLEKVEAEMREPR